MDKLSNQVNALLSKCITNISNNLKHLLSLYSMNILELAKDVGISYSALYRLVHGESNPNLETLLKVSKAFDISVSQLLGDLPILKDKYSIRSIPIINWQDIINFLSDKKNNMINTDNYLFVSTKDVIPNKCFALTLNTKNMDFFIPGTMFVFAPLLETIKNYDHKFVLISYNKEKIPVLQKLYFEGDRIFVQSINPRIPACELLAHEAVLAYLIQTKIDF